jgi:hypothetical protein
MATKTTSKNGSEIEALRAELAEAKAKLAAKTQIRFKVSEKGGLSVYGLGRFPVTLYIGQWERLIEAMPELQAFAKAHNAEFDRKD